MSDLENGGRARAFEALRASEELHRATLGSISDAVFLTDDSGAFTFICPNVDVIFGYAPDEVQAMGRLQRLLGDGLFDLAELDRRGELRNVEREVATKGGQRRFVLVHFKRVSIQGGTVLCTCRDVTELKATERELALTRLELAHEARLAVVGEMTQSIVHDLSQPLAAIGVNASAGIRLADQEEPGSSLVAELRAILADIHDVSRDAGALVARLRTLGRKQPLDLRELDFNVVAQEVFHVVGADAQRRGVMLHAQFAPSLPVVLGDRVSLQQVLLNLIVNAMDAMSTADSPERRVVLRTRSVDGGIECSVSDTGPGIPTNALSRVFDPFFTTKEHGVGLGLAIARSLVQAHAGQISVENEVGRGATFRLTLPVK
jgi:PAS domain S-box-containing protein